MEDESFEPGLARTKSTSMLGQADALGSICEIAEYEEEGCETGHMEDILRDYTEVTFSIAWRARQMEDTPIILAGDVTSPISMPRFLMPCSLAPPFVCFTIGKRRQLFLQLCEHKQFTVNYCSDDFAEEVLQEITQHYFDGHVDTEIDLFRETHLRLMHAKTIEAPILSGCACCFECEVARMVETGDHMLVVASVVVSYVHQSASVKKTPRRSRRFSVAY